MEYTNFLTNEKPRKQLAFKIFSYLHYYQGQNAESGVKHENVCVLCSKTIFPTGQL